jgi:hypothetical protein
MDKKQQLFIYTAAAHMLLSMMAMIIQSRKRKRREPVAYIQGWLEVPSLSLPIRLLPSLSGGLPWSPADGTAGGSC